MTKGADGAKYVYFAAFLIMCLLLQTNVGAFNADLGRTGDESGHFVTSVMVFDFLSGRHFWHPLSFAINYYQHFPRVAIGHWPPFFYVLQALFFFFAGPSLPSACVLQAVIGAAAAGVPASLAYRRWGAVAGFFAGCLVLLSPPFADMVSTVMVDNLCGLMILLSALAWAKFWKERNWTSALVLTGISICTALTKGNALGLVLMPAIFCCLNRNAGILRCYKTWVAAVVIGVVVIPWYVLTYKMTAAGFEYSFGWRFTSLALPEYSTFLLSAIGIPALAGLLVMLWRLARTRREEQDPYLTALASAVISLFVFQAIAPAAINARYLMSLLPAAAPLAVGGIALIGRAVEDYVGRFEFDWHKRAPAAITSLFVGIVVSISLVATPAVSRVEPTEMRSAAKAVFMSGASNPLVLVCANPDSEGAFIAAFAELEPAPRHYVIRGSQAFATMSWINTGYRSFVTSPSQVKQWVDGHQIGWLVIERSRRSMDWSHNRTVAALVDSKPTNWRQAAYFQYAGDKVEVYALPASRSVPTKISETIASVLSRSNAQAGFGSMARSWNVFPTARTRPH